MLARIFSFVLMVFSSLVWGAFLFLFWKMYGDTAFGWLTADGTVPQMSYVNAVALSTVISVLGACTTAISNSVALEQLLEEFAEDRNCTKNEARVWFTIGLGYIMPIFATGCYGVYRILLFGVEMLAG